jgi:hypothetical protein
LLSRFGENRGLKLDILLIVFGIIFIILNKQIDMTMKWMQKGAWDNEKEVFKYNRKMLIIAGIIFIAIGIVRTFKNFH